MVVMVAAGGGRYWIDGVRDECSRCDGRFWIWERLGEGLRHGLWQWTGFHVSYSVFITGPPAVSGFPYTHNKASGLDRLPCLCRIF